MPLYVTCMGGRLVPVGRPGNRTDSRTGRDSRVRRETAVGCGVRGRCVDQTRRPRALVEQLVTGNQPAIETKQGVAVSSGIVAAGLPAGTTRGARSSR